MTEQTSLSKNPNPSAPLYIGLVHYPVYDKNHDVVRTSVTTIDVHDFSRNARTYGVASCHIITPVIMQQEIIDRLIGHWQKGYGSEYNPSRKEALGTTRLFNDIAESARHIEESEGDAPLLIATSASLPSPSLSKEFSFQQMHQHLYTEKRPVLLLFGTGWGMTEEVFKLCEGTLSPVCSPFGFNHLPVRSACAIILDRIHRPSC